MSVEIMNSIKNRENPNDKIYTPPQVVDIMINFCGYKEGDNVLEPAKGLGAIYDKLKSPKDYSLMDKFLNHTYTLCNKFCFLIGCYSLTPKRINIMNNNGFYITKMLLTKIPSWFQRSYIIVCEKLDEEPKNIIFKSLNLGNKCLYCKCPCGGMRGKNIKHCKRKSNENICHY